MKIKALGSVKNGELQVYSKSKLQKAIQSMEGCIVEIIIRQKTKGRSNQQNKYYWGVALGIVESAISEENGVFIGIETAHEIVKIHLNGFEVFDFDRMKVEKEAQSTANLTTDEFEELIENLRRWANDLLGVYIPMPNEETVLFTN